MSKTDEKISVKGAIGELLYEHECVIVPKFGGFVKEYKPSSFDYVQGKISPPSSLISFNDNLVVDDGLLIDFYKRKNEVSLKEAQEDVKQFAKKSKITLENREVVSLPKVGRLLKDYENLIKFIPENHNFNTETFGLPKVRYYPILRDIPENEVAATPAAATATATVPKKRVVPKRKSEKKRKSQQIARIAIPVVIVIMLASAYNVMSRFDDDKSIVELEEGASLGHDKVPINVSPVEEPINGDEEPDNSVDPMGHEDTQAHAEDITDMGNIADDTGEFDEVEEAISNPIVPEAVEASGTVIFVGYFSKQKGVDRTVAKIEKNNWTSYTKSVGSGTKVGLVVPKGESANALLKQVEKVFKEGAFIEEL